MYQQETEPRRPDHKKKEAKQRPQGTTDWNGKNPHPGRITLVMYYNLGLGIPGTFNMLELKRSPSETTQRAGLRSPPICSGTPQIRGRISPSPQSVQHTLATPR